MTSDMSAQFGSQDLTNKATEMLGQLEQQATSATEIKSHELPPQQEQQTQQQVQQQTPQSSVVDLNDDVVVKVKIDGQEQDVPLKELKNGYSRESVFTQRMQTLAAQRKQLEDYFAAQQAQMIQQQQALQLAQQELQRNNPLSQLGQLLQQQNAPKPKNPNEIATIGEIEQAQQQLLQQFQQARAREQQAIQQELARVKQETQQEFEIRQDQAKFSAALAEVLNSEDGKMLSEINPLAESIVRFQTLQMNPQTTDEAIKAMKEYVAGWAGQVKGRFQTQQKAAQVTQAKTVMEPPSGSPAPTIMQPKLQVMKKDGGVDYAALRAKALSLLD